MNALHRWIEDRAAAAGRSEPATGRLVMVPVCYGGELGPDLETVGRGAWPECR